MDLPLPVIDRRPLGARSLFIVRDDLIPGGTKRCYVDALIAPGDHVSGDPGASSASGAPGVPGVHDPAPLGREVVYASPVYGGAQIAIAHAARALGIRATIFAAERRVIHGRTAEALLAGARLVQVPHGYLTNVQAQARRYAELRGARLLPFGLDTPEALEAIAARARAAQAQTGPLAEVWCAGGSGVLCRGLQLGLAAAGPGGSRPAFHVVQVGARLGPAQAGCARVHVAPERFEDDARRPPPFPSCSNYDAKVWAEMGRSRGDGPILFWNVLG